jgi:hypothetical protein
MVMDLKALERAFARLEKFEEAEEERHIERLVDLKVRLRLAEMAAANGSGLRRSAMSAKVKSEIIRSRGVEFYRSLPW